MMRKRLHQRLQQLEVAAESVRKRARLRDQAHSMEKARNKILLFLRVCGVEQQGHESVMEAWARALGMALKDLRATLRAGIDPIRKYFTEHGVVEEIERRKAAGTWPGGGKTTC